MDINTITQSARIVIDEQGTSVVVLPLSLWQELLGQLSAQPPQHERIKAILKRWEADPDDKSTAWWDEFDAELNTSRTTFSERDLGLDEA